MSVEVGGSFAGIPLAGWIGFLALLAVKGALVIACAFALARILDRASARWRSRVWTASYLLLLSLPLAGGLPILFSGASLGDHLWAPAALPAIDSAVLRVLPDPLPADPVVPVATNTASTVGTAETTRAWGLLLPAIWLFGAALLALRTGRALWSGRVAAHAALPLERASLTKLVGELRSELGIRCAVELRIRDDLDVPFVWSARRAIIVLPAELVSWEEGALRQLLAHELAHVKRRDLARLALIELVGAIFWFHPLTRPAERRARLEIEMDCDEVACGLEDRHERAQQPGSSARTRLYARQLVWFAQRRATRLSCAPAIAGTHEVEERLLNILQRARPVRGRWVSAVALPALGALLCLPLVSTRPEASDVSGPLPARASGLATALGEAAAAGESARVLELIELDPALLETPDRHGMTPLALAAWNGHSELVEALAMRGANLERRNRNGLTPLFCAMDRSRWDMARCLMANGADPFTRGFRGRSLLHEAARHGEADLAQVLLEAGVPVNQTDVDGTTPLDHATWNGRDEVAELLRASLAVSGSVARPGWAQPRQGKSPHADG